MRSTSFIAVFLLLTVTVVTVTAEIQQRGWWKHTVFYQVYPRSFMDSRGTGTGDLKGITSKLQHFKDSGIGAIWLSPIYKSPMNDNGYDVANFREIDPMFGTLQDLEALIKEAHRLGLKVVLDLVPNHTSDQHEWFDKSVKKEGKYADYYIWNDGKKNGSETVPINNWLSVFGGSGWTWNEKRGQYYYHQFYASQPELNYMNPEVVKEMKDVMKFWLDKEIDGFRIDAVPHLFENNITQDEPRSNDPNAKENEHNYLNHTLTKDQQQTYELIQDFRNFVDNYASTTNQSEKVIMTEAYTSWENTLKYYKYGSHVPFNFKFIIDASKNSVAADFKNIIDRWTNGVPQSDMVSNWVMGNHDRSRIASRFPGRADQMVMLSMVLPGVAVTYYGEEIGMEDKVFENQKDFRDGCRTPFQWDNTINAGFSTSTNGTWLAVNENYRSRNLAKQKVDDPSDYKLYTRLTSLRNFEPLKTGSLKTSVLGSNGNILAVVRNGTRNAVTLLINFSDNSDETVDLSKLVEGSEAQVNLTTLQSTLKLGTKVALSKVTVPAKSSVILVSGASTATYSIASMLLIALILLFKS